MSNAPEILRELEGLCTWGHSHEPLVNGKAREAAKYPPELCRAICRGLIRQRQHQGDHVKSLLSVEAKDTIDELPEHEEDQWNSTWAWDDANNKTLNPEGVRKARQEEMEYVNSKNVWVKMRKEEAIKEGYNIVDTRWIDTDKGDEAKPNYRSRLVGKEFNTGPEEGLFASTPPLEALRWLISEAATMEEGGRQGTKVMLLADVSRAFFEAAARRKVAVILPEEALAPGESKEDIVGALKQSLYGTRDAAANFQNEVKHMMAKAGFNQLKYNASLYHNPITGVRVMVHGDDFVAVGRRDKVQAFRKQVAARFTIKDKVIGLRPDLKEEAEARILNRIVRITPQGWEYEADQRHADIIAQELGLSKARATRTAGEDEPSWKMEEGDRPLDKHMVTKFRALAARANYLAADRLDIQYAVKECCRGMASPEHRHWDRLKRIGRYLAGRPRAVWRYHWQGMEKSPPIRTVTLRDAAAHQGPRAVESS